MRSLGIPLGYKDWELSLWPHRFHDHDLNAYVRYAFHALSIDDRRQQFLPTLWNEPTKAQETGDPVGQTFEQVWFPGVHSDVGGGYEDSGLSDIALAWMIDKALGVQDPLHLQAPPTHRLDPRPTGELHDSREGFWQKLVYRDVPRFVCKGHQEPLSKATVKTGEAFLHTSWLERIGALYEAYDTPHLGAHPDYVRAVDQLKRGIKPPHVLGSVFANGLERPPFTAWRRPSLLCQGSARKLDCSPFSTADHVGVLVAVYVLAGFVPASASSSTECI